MLPFPMSHPDNRSRRHILSASDRQHELDASPVRHLRQPDTVEPTAGPAFGHLRDRAAGGAVGAEQAQFEPVGASHCGALTVTNLGPQGHTRRLFLP
jgi:hypothetical protein